MNNQPSGNPGELTSREREQAAFEDWLSRTCPSGDEESVKRQWEGSSDFADFLESERPLWSKMREKVDAVIRDHTWDTYVCGRVWSAWNVGTMDENDFTPFHSGDTVENLVYSLEEVYEPEIHRLERELAAKDAVIKGLKDLCERARSICQEDDDEHEKSDWLTDYEAHLLSSAGEVGR